MDRAARGDYLPPSEHAMYDIASDTSGHVYERATNTVVYDMASNPYHQQQPQLSAASSGPYYSLATSATHAQAPTYDLASGPNGGQASYDRLYAGSASSVYYESMQPTYSLASAPPASSAGSRLAQAYIDASSQARRAPGAPNVAPRLTDVPLPRYEPRQYVQRAPGISRDLQPQPRQSKKSRQDLRVDRLRLIELLKETSKLAQEADETAAEERWKAYPLERRYKATSTVKPRESGHLELESGDLVGVRIDVSWLSHCLLRPDEPQHGDGWFEAECTRTGLVGLVSAALLVAAAQLAGL